LSFVELPARSLRLVSSFVALTALFYFLYNFKKLTVKCFVMSRIAEPCERQEDQIRVSSRQKRQLVARVVNSQMFRRSSALCAFLHYITNHEILGQADKLKEQTIGVEVLGRRADYLPTSDNIVRVRAHELRGRLERYFATEGANEPVVITIPVGSYAPVFEPRKTAAGEAPAVSPVAQNKSSPNKTGSRLQRYFLPLVAIVVIALSASVVVVIGVLRESAHHRVAALEPTGAIQDFWGQFFDKPQGELNVVYADPGFALWQDLNGKTLNLGDYLNGRYLSVGKNKLFNAAIRPVASSADIEIVAHLGILAGEFGGQINLEFARDATLKVFQRGNVVLLGSHRSNPWVELYEPSLNFVLEQDPHTGMPLFRNRSPRPGEMPVYTVPTNLGNPGSDEKDYTRYGVAALLKGCGNRGLTVLAEGLNTQGTHAVGDIFTEPQRLDALLKSIGHKPGTTVAPFEALIQITSFPNNFDNPKVIAFRLPPPGSCVSY
jgi:hypothetical protein